VSGVQSVDRAVSVLEILARSGEAGVSEVAAEVELHKSTVFRLLGALEARGLVEQVRERGKYRLGFGLLRLAGGVTDRIDIAQQGRPVLERLAALVGETVNIGVRQSVHAVNLSQVSGPGTVKAHNWVGQLTPLHATASGKVLLAYLDAVQRTRVLDEAGLNRLTPSTMTSLDALELDLGRARERGYALTLGELEVGLNGAAVPIRSHAAQVFAAVSASGPAYRFTEQRIHEVAPFLIDAGEEISRRVGFPG
jgi:DNA-binding IclR family transcriptional regulator